MTIVSETARAVVTSPIKLVLFGFIIGAIVGGLAGSAGAALLGACSDLKSIHEMDPGAIDAVDAGVFIGSTIAGPFLGFPLGALIGAAVGSGAAGWASSCSTVRKSALLRLGVFATGLSAAFIGMVGGLMVSTGHSDGVVPWLAVGALIGVLSGAGGGLFLMHLIAWLAWGRSGISCVNTPARDQFNVPRALKGA